MYYEEDDLKPALYVESRTERSLWGRDFSIQPDNPPNLGPNEVRLHCYVVMSL